MILLFKLIIINAIWVLGIKISTSEGMIFERLGDWGKKKVEKGYKVYEGLINCEWCLPSFHSVFAYAFAFGLEIIPFEWNWKYIIMWPLVIMGTSLITGMTWTIYLTISQMKAYFKFLNGEK